MIENERIMGKKDPKQENNETEIMEELQVRHKMVEANWSSFNQKIYKNMDGEDEKSVN